jgi:hypothetical protein
MTKAMWTGCAAVAAVALCWQASAESSYPGGVASALAGSRELVTHFQEPTAGPTVLTVVDPATKALAVYHISRDTGEIKLRSVRNFAWDLQLMEFNSASPSPDDIRKGFDRQ